MSNGDDVLDSWEEIDEVGLNSTLQKIQAERQSQRSLLKDSQTKDSTASTDCQIQPMKVLQRNSAQERNSGAADQKSPLNSMAATFQPVMMVLHKEQDEYHSANYTQPINTKTVKILRRPTQSSESRNNDMRPRQPIKTLQQREAEYAEARLRIMGSAKNPEDDAGASNPSSTAQVTATAPSVVTMTPKSSMSPKPPNAQPLTLAQQIGPNVYNINYQHQIQPPLLPHTQAPPNYYYHQQQQPQPAYNNRTMPPQTWSPVVGGSVSSPALRQQQQQQQQESILRLPRGPDGSNGFQTRR